jgi:hypothetical protein
MGAMGIFWDHSVKLYQIIDDFAQAGGGCQRPRGYFQAFGSRNPAR